VIQKLLPLCLMLSACAGATNAPQPVVSYRPVTPASTPFASPLEIAQWLAGNFPESAEGGPRLDISLKPWDDGKFQLLVRKQGLLDDSVSGQSYLATLVRKEDGWMIVTLGENWQCARSSAPDAWVMTPCP
jgi:hypothetical protein